MSASGRVAWPRHTAPLVGTVPLSRGPRALPGAAAPPSSRSVDLARWPFFGSQWLGVRDVGDAACREVGGLGRAWPLHQQLGTSHFLRTQRISVFSPVRRGQMPAGVAAWPSPASSASRDDGAAHGRRFTRRRALGSS